jgi:hypothetical protein
MYSVHFKHLCRRIGAGDKQCTNFLKLKWCKPLPISTQNLLILYITTRWQKYINATYYTQITWAIPKVMSKFILYWNNGHVQKQIPSRVTDNIPSLFHEILQTVQALPSGLHNLEYITAAEVHFSILQPHVHGLLHGLVISMVLFPHVIF